MSIHHLIASYGYLAVFALVGIESLGIPLPGETTLIAAATYAGSTHRLWVWLIFVVAAAGAIIGDTIGFWIGDLGGYRLIYRYGRYIHFDEPKVKLARYLFDRRGGAVVFFGRFVSVLRTYAAFLAGTSRMHYRTFLLFNAAGGVVWAAFYTFSAYYAGSFLSRVGTPIQIGVGVGAVVAVAVGLLTMRHHLRALQAAAEVAYPGPLEDPRHHERAFGEGREPRDGRHRSQGASPAGEQPSPAVAPSPPDGPSAPGGASQSAV